MIDTRMPYKIHGLFHTLWSKAVGMPDYVKAEWRELEAEIEALSDRAVKLEAK